MLRSNNTIIAKFAVVLVSLIFGISSAFASDYPARPMTIIVPFGVGGGNDVIARTFAPYLAQELGVPVNIENRPGAGSLVGATALLNSNHDGHTMMFSSVTPFIAQTILVRGASYSAEDFQLIDLPSRDYSLIKASTASGISSYEEFIERLRANPRNVTIGVAPGSADFANIVLTLERHGINPDAARIVTYDGGGETRLAVLAGHVDVGVSPASASFSIKEDITPLALFADQVVAGFEEVHLVSDIEGRNIDFMPGSQRGWVVSTEFINNHPDRYEVLSNAIRNVSHDETYLVEIDRQLPGYTWYGPEDSNAAFLRAFNQTSEYMHKMQP